MGTKKLDVAALCAYVEDSASGYFMSTKVPEHKAVFTLRIIEIADLLLH